MSLIPKKGTVYVVDDDEAVRDSLQWLLEGRDYRVRCFDSAESFLSRYDPREVGCVLVDIRMSGMSGQPAGVHPVLEVGTVDFCGWRGLRLANGLVQIVAVPDIGGRIMACDLLGQGEHAPHPFLFVDPDLAGKLFTPEENQGDGSLAAWKNYGGDKTWPAPQGWDHDGQWHGPPDPVLDSGRHTLDRLALDGGRAVIAMTSPPDPRTASMPKRSMTRAFNSASALRDTIATRGRRLG